MVQTKRYKALSFLLVLFFSVNTVFQPEVVQAQTGTAVDPQTARIYSYFEGFTTAAPEAIGQAMLLSEQVASLQAQPSDTVVQTDFETTRELAWETASQISMAQGSLGGLLRSLEAVGIEGQTAVDVISTTQSIRNNGLDPELQTELVALGLTVDQVHTIEASTNTHLETRQQVATSGFQTRTVTLLESNGLTTTQIDDIADTYGRYGLADSTAQSKIDQLYQTQDELTLARDQALIAYSQLLSQQVFWRQENGVTAVPLASAEIDTLVQDQLRLLTHIGYLNTLWGQDEAPEVGEGQWLFIERYSQQALERTETLVLESQETGLLIDLFILAQIHQVALTAQSGDPIQAKQDLDYLGDLLANMLGNNVPSGANYQTQVPFLWQVALQASTLWGDNSLLIYLDSYDVAQAISQENLAQEKLTQRVAKLTAPAQLPLSAGSIGESDETNNTDFVVFSVSAPPLEPDLLNFLQQFVDGFENLLTEAWNIITGQSDNPLGIGINIVLSFIPIVGELLDLIAIFTEPTVWGKVMAAIGLAASFASDIAELATALGIVFPPALVAAPAAVATELVDIASAILKNIDNLVRPLANLFANMPFNRAFELGGQAVNRLAAMAGDFFRGVDGNIHLPGISDIINYMEGVRESLIRPLIALAERFNGRLDDLFRIGFGDGGFLAGRALRQNANLSDEAIDVLASYGDEAGNALDNLTDEAIDGLGDLAEEAGESGIRSLDVGLNCIIGATSRSSQSRFAKLTSQNGQQNSCNALRQQALAFIGETAAEHWGDEAIEGIGRLINSGVSDDAIQRLLLAGGPAPEQVFRVIGGKTGVTWNVNTAEGLARAFERSPNIERLSNSLVEYGDDVVEETLIYIDNMSVNGLLDDTDDARDLFEWRSRQGNQLSSLDQVTAMRRQTISDADYQANWRTRLEQDWNDGQNFNNDPVRLAEALAIDPAVDQLKAIGYQEVFVLRGRGLQGPDAILWNPQTNRWVILEGKGTFTPDNFDLSLGDFSLIQNNTVRQPSRAWILNDRTGYLNRIDDPVVRQQVRDMFDDIQAGANYEVVLSMAGFGGNGSETLEYGSNLTQLFNEISGGNGWSVSFVFTRLQRQNP